MLPTYHGRRTGQHWQPVHLSSPWHLQQLRSCCPQPQLQQQDRVLNARIAYTEAEVLRLRDKGESKSKSTHKSGIMDSRKIYPEKLKDMARWKKWSARALRWATP